MVVVAVVGEMVEVGVAPFSNYLASVYTIDSQFFDI